MKWEVLQNNVNGIKEAAEIYENAFNDVLEQVTNNDNFEKVGGQVTAVFPPLMSSCVKWCMSLTLFRLWEAFEASPPPLLKR